MYYVEDGNPYFRYGRPEDWQSVRWSVKDLGGLNGTFVNQVLANSFSEGKCLLSGLFRKKALKMPFFLFSPARRLFVGEKK